MRRLGIALCFCLCTQAVHAQANGKLQIHFMDVGQGDGALLISPQGETILFDDGALNNCDKPLSYLQQLGVSKIDYHIASHYHSDHIGCAPQVFHDFPLQKDALDRGGSYNSSTYQNYVMAVGSHRKTATANTTITLDAASSNPVTVQIVALNGNGVQTTNENDLSVVAVVHFGNFDGEIGGDLSGYKTDSYEDIETSVAPLVGQVEVYKVHHHGSRYSSNDTWLATVKPLVGIVSTGDGNKYNHPTQECLERLHSAGVKTYWTETGNGTTPEAGQDIVSGNIIVQAAPGSDTFTVTYNGNQIDTYHVWGSSPSPGPTPTPTTATYAWSKKSKVYHYLNCRFVANINPDNLVTGATAPADKTLHEGCPK